MDGGGHLAHPDQIRETYAASLKNLSRAVVELDEVAIYDNGTSIPELFVRVRDGRIVFRGERLPNWIWDVIGDEPDR